MSDTIELEETQIARTESHERFLEDQQSDVRTVKQETAQQMVSSGLHLSATSDYNAQPIHFTEASSEKLNSLNCASKSEEVNRERADDTFP